jgi:hypothetical protein
MSQNAKTAAGRANTLHWRPGRSGRTLSARRNVLNATTHATPPRPGEPRILARLLARDVPKERADDAPKDAQTTPRKDFEDN